MSRRSRFPQTSLVTFLAIGLAIGLGAGCLGDSGQDDGNGDGFAPSATGAGETGDFDDETGGDDELETGAEGGDSQTCASADFITDPGPAPTVVLLLDQSGSMDADFGGDSRWDVMVSAITGSDNGIVTAHEDKVEFGLALYHGAKNEGDACPALTTVDAAPFAATAIDDVLSNTGPQQQTPTGESLAAIAADLAADTSIEGDKIIVLATDGAPDTCADSSAHDDTAMNLVVEAAKNAHADGIQTRVISVGPEGAAQADHLQDVANAGVGYEVGGVDNAAFYEALDAEALFSAFDDIITSAVGCSYEITGEVDMDSMCDGTVTLDGEAIECGTDWTVEDNTLKLLGATCDKLSDGESHQISANWTCEVYIP